MFKCHFRCILTGPVYIIEVAPLLAMRRIDVYEQNCFDAPYEGCFVYTHICLPFPLTATTLSRDKHDRKAHFSPSRYFNPDVREFIRDNIRH